MKIKHNQEKQMKYLHTSLKINKVRKQLKVLLKLMQIQTANKSYSLVKINKKIKNNNNLKINFPSQDIKNNFHNHLILKAHLCLQKMKIGEALLLQST